MAMSGVTMDEDCQKIFEAIKTKREHRYATFKITDKIECDKIGARDKKYQDFLDDMQQIEAGSSRADCRYGVYDFEFTMDCAGTEEGASYRSKVCLFMWCPDEAAIKKKMVYSSSFDVVKKAFKGAQKFFEGHSADELEEDAIRLDLMKGTRS